MYFCTSSDPETRMKVQSVWCATALARSVFPVPGGPYKRTPLGCTARAITAKKHAKNTKRGASGDAASGFPLEGGLPEIFQGRRSVARALVDRARRAGARGFSITVCCIPGRGLIVDSVERTGGRTPPLMHDVSRKEPLWSH